MILRAVQAMIVAVAHQVVGIKEVTLSFQYFDIIQIALFLLVCFVSYKLFLNKKWKILIGLWVVCLIGFFNMPVVTENNQARILFTSQPQELPDKVEAEKENFKQAQKDELDSLRKDNKITEENL